MRSISGPIASDTATAVPASTDRARPTALTEAPRSRPISTTSGASTTIDAWVAAVASTSGRRRRHGRLPAIDRSYPRVTGAVTVPSVSWEPELDELRRREALAREMGGQERVARQHASGRLTVRERVERLFDAASFHETGAIAGRGDYDEAGELTGFLPANMVVGQGRIDGRRAVVQGDDFTVRGGAADAAIWQKMVYAERMAHDLRLPLVRLVDGTGGGGSVKSLESMGFTYVPFVPGFELTVANLSRVPVAAAALGPVAGLGAARVVASHFSVIVKGTSQLFVAGPPVVAAAMGETPDKEELGGARAQARAGAVDNVAADEDDALAQLRGFLSYLPGSVWEAPPIIEQRRSRGPARGGAAGSRAARAPPAVRGAPDPGPGPGQRLTIRAGRVIRSLADHGVRASGGTAGGGAGQRPEALRRRAHGRRVGEGGSVR